MWTLNNPLVQYYGKKALVLVIISFSALVFSTGLSGRVKIFDSDLYTGKGDDGKDKPSGTKNPTGTYPGFLLQAIILLLTFHHFGDDIKGPNGYPIVKGIKNLLQLFAVTGYAFALGATNLSRIMEKKFTEKKKTFDFVPSTWDKKIWH